MKKFILGAIALLILEVVVLGVFVSMGLVGFPATAKHSPAIDWLISTARTNYLSRSAQRVVAPADLASEERVRRGAGNYQAMCSECHLSPGSGQTELSRGLNPVPPDFTSTPGRLDDVQRFIAIKYGIRGSGMPAWQLAGLEDGDVWDLAALLKVLPDLNSNAYQHLIMESGGHSHATVPASNDSPSLAPPSPASSEVPISGHVHSGTSGHSHQH